LAPISRKLHLGRVRGLSRKTIEVPLASKKQSPPVRGIGSAVPSTLSQQLPRESMAKCAKSVDDIFLSEGVTFSSVWFSCFIPHGAVASSLCRPKAVTCIVLKMSVIESNLRSLFWTNRQNIRTPEEFSSTTKELYSTVPNVTHLSKGVIMGKLEGKVAVITGGSSGMALASARRFVEEGAYVFITGRRQEQLDEAVKLIGRNVTGVRGDAANLDDLDRLFDTVKREKGKIDVLFASAGRGEALPMGEITEQHFDATFGLNTRGTLFTVQKALPLFNDGGSIIMTGSVASVKGFPGFGVYAASKAALRSFARTWLNELKGRNIRVNVLGPGPIATPMQEQVLTKEAKEMFESLIPRGKMGQPEEIAAVALFLASDDSSFVNGVELNVDGGFSAI
jgi:NAD(P)-dependent dehydrogenase (short-subunit alcohol dehydrogenase family)